VSHRRLKGHHFPTSSFEKHSECHASRLALPMQPRNESEKGERAVVEAIRDQWVIVVGALVLVALVGWLVAGRSR
jgi:hypothetical protein